MDALLREHGLVPLHEVEGLAHAAKGVPLRDRRGQLKAFAVVDADDFAWASERPWYRNNAGYVVRSTYPHGRGRAVTLGLHRAVMGTGPGDRRQVDHVNRDTLDNRKANLRFCDASGNQQNKSDQRGGSSRFRGVSLRRDRGDWHAYARVHGKQYHLGFFATEGEAADAAAAFREKHMPFATT